MRNLLSELHKKFEFACSTSGGNYRVCVEVSGIGFLISGDCIMFCTINNKILSCKEIIKLYETEEGMEQLEDADNLTLFAEWDNSVRTLKFYSCYFKDKSIYDSLFRHYKKAENILGTTYMPKEYSVE